MAKTKFCATQIYVGTREIGHSSDCCFVRAHWAQVRTYCPCKALILILRNKVECPWLAKLRKAVGNLLKPSTRFVVHLPLVSTTMIRMSEKRGSLNWGLWNTLTLWITVCAKIQCTNKRRKLHTAKHRTRGVLPYHNKIQTAYESFH